MKRFRPGRRLVLAMLLTCATGTLACGVKLDAEQDMTEIFRDATVTNATGEGDLVAGQPLQLTVEYWQPYPNQLDIECDLLASNKETKVADIHVEAILANVAENIPTSIRKNYKDEVTPISGTLQPAFVAPEAPGTYVVNCFTQEDDNNEIERTIVIGPAPEVTATPTQP
jgi:hypothetical protein